MCVFYDIDAPRQNNNMIWIYQPLHVFHFSKLPSKVGSRRSGNLIAIGFKLADDAHVGRSMDVDGDAACAFLRRFCSFMSTATY